MPLNTDLFFLYCANQIYTEQRTQEKNTMIQWMDKTDEMMLIKIIPWAACFVKMLGLIYKKRFGRTVLPITGSDFHFTNAKKGKILMGCYGNVDVLMNEAPIFCGWGGGMGWAVLLHCGKQPFCLEPVTEAKRSESVFSIYEVQNPYESLLCSSSLQMPACV